MECVRTFCCTDVCFKVREYFEQIPKFLKELATRIYHYFSLTFFEQVNIAHGSQAGNIGPIARERVHFLCDILNARKVQGVFFNVAAIQLQIADGTCSAMSFDFINEYLTQKSLGTSGAYDIIRKISDRYLVSTQEFMNNQAAFDTIARNPHEYTTDFKQSKIAAMLKLFHRNVIYSSEEINLSSPWCEAKVSQVMASLPEGIFVLRTLSPATNAKEEGRGHSMVYVNEGNQKFFYDPNHGVNQLHPVCAAKLIHNSLQQVHNLYSAPSARFYQVI